MMNLSCSLRGKYRFNILILLALLFIQLFFFSHKALAEDLDIDILVSSIQKTYEKIDTLSAVFKQKIYSVAINNPVVSSGSVYFRRPGMMKWAYDNPAGDIIVGDGTTLWVYQSDLNQVMVSNNNRIDGFVSQHLFQVIKNLLRDFSVALLSGTTKNSGTFALSLIPLKPLPNIDKLYIYVDKKDMLIKRTTLFSPFGDRTVIDFYKINLNLQIKKDFFQFTIPEGVDIIR